MRSLFAEIMARMAVLQPNLNSVLDLHLEPLPESASSPKPPTKEAASHKKKDSKEKELNRDKLDREKDKEKEKENKLDKGAPSGGDKEKPKELKDTTKKTKSKGTKAGGNRHKKKLRGEQADLVDLYRFAEKRLEELRYLELSNAMSASSESIPTEGGGSGGGAGFPTGAVTAEKNHQRKKNDSKEGPVLLQSLSQDSISRIPAPKEIGRAHV